MVAGHDSLAQRAAGRAAERAAGRAAGDAGAWYREIAGMVDDPAGGDLPERLVRALGHLVPFELATVFVYRGRSRPLVIYDNFELVGAKEGIKAYVENTYVLNPFYQAYLKDIRPGVYRIRDLAPDAFFESKHHGSFRILPRNSEEIGFVTENWPEGMEEITIVIELEGSEVGELGLYRSCLVGGFGARDLAQLSAVEPVIGALFRRYWKDVGAARFRVSPPDNRVDEAFANFGATVLTGRECEVVQLILRGHSSESIGFNLGISLGTVKTHRKNAYARLEISSQSELLSLFLRSLQAT